MDWAHDGAATSSTANVATATRVGRLGGEMLESAAGCCAGAVPGPAITVPEPGVAVPGSGVTTKVPEPPADVPWPTIEVPGSPS